MLWLCSLTHIFPFFSKCLKPFGNVFPALGLISIKPPVMSLHSVLHLLEKCCKMKMLSLFSSYVKASEQASKSCTRATCRVPCMSPLPTVLATVCELCCAVFGLGAARKPRDESTKRHLQPKLRVFGFVSSHGLLTLLCLPYTARCVATHTHTDVLFLLDCGLSDLQCVTMTVETERHQVHCVHEWGWERRIDLTLCVSQCLWCSHPTSI